MTETGFTKLRLGTRGSALAVAQSSMVARDLERVTGLPVELVKVTTHGDVNRASLASMGGMGVFATELRQALLAGECDLVVHSLKDLPVAPCPGLELAAFPARVDAGDALCAGSAGINLRDLPHGARVGTGSPRRAAQLRRLRPDLQLVDIRGNVETRLAYVTRGELDAVILACAGLIRLGFEDRISSRLDCATEMIPAAGQGTLAIEVRAGDVIPGVADLDCAESRLAITAERELLRLLGAGCHTPVGAYAVVDSAGNGELSAVVASACGTRSVRVSVPVAGDALAAASAAHAELTRRGAQEILALNTDTAVDADGGVRWAGARLLIVPSSLNLSVDQRIWLGEQGFDVLEHEFIRIVPRPNIPGKTDAEWSGAISALNRGEIDTIAFTSGAGVSAFAARIVKPSTNVKFAAVGERTALRIKDEFGVEDVLVPDAGRDGLALAKALIDNGAKTVLWPRAAAASEVLSETLRAAGKTVFKPIVYDTDENPLSDFAYEAITQAESIAVLLTSGSSARAYAARKPSADVTIIAIGNTTATECEKLGLTVAAIADSPTLEAMITALIEKEQR